MNVCATVVLVASLFAALQAATTTTQEETNTSVIVPQCEDGHFIYGESCYFFERERTFTWEEAKEFCADMKGTLWVPNCVDEWNTIRNHTQFTRHTWLGARAKDAKPCSSSVEWVNGEKGMDERDLPWVVETDNHGYVGEAKCVAYVNRHGDVSDKVHFYLCDSPKYHVICEKNSTIPFEPPADAPLCSSCKLCRETTVKKTVTTTNTDDMEPDTTVKKTVTTTKTEDTKPDTTTMATTTTMAETTTMAATTTTAANTTTMKA